MRNTSLFLLLLAAMLILSGQAAAQLDIPSTAEPSRVQEQIAPPAPPALPDSLGTVKSGAAVEAPEGAAEATFLLKAVIIEGMTVYTEADIAPLYRDMLGKTVSLVDIYRLAEQLTAKYRNAGYILSQVIIPPQTIEKEGSIRLTVIEGYIDHIDIRSKNHHDTTFLAPYDRIIEASRPLNAKALEKYLLLINDLPGMTAKSVLSPSPTAPGASSMTLMIERKPYDASLQVDNRGSLYMGPVQFNSSARLNNPFGSYEAFSLQLVTTPDGHPQCELDYASFGMSRPLGALGAVMNLSGSVTSTTPGHTLEQFEVEGLAHAYSAGMTFPFIRSRNENLYATLKFDYLDTVRTDNLGDPEIEDRLRVLRLNALYQAADRFQGVNTLTGELSRGLNIFDTKMKGSPNMTRAAGDPVFFKVTFDASRLQRLTEKVDLFVAATGQWSADPLLASEEFGVGGAAYGSAYDSSEITGRHGLAARFELRANNPVSTPLQDLQVYGFYDVGKVWDPQNAARRDRIRSLASAGAGLRVALNSTFSGSCELAVPLTRRVETEQNNSPRLFGAFTATF